MVLVVTCAVVVVGTGVVLVVTCAVVVVGTGVVLVVANGVVDVVTGLAVFIIVSLYAPTDPYAEICTFSNGDPFVPL